MISVVDPGPLTSVQDPAGRPGWRRYGVPVGGAADGWSARLANRLVGNVAEAAVLEVTLGGATFDTHEPTVLAICGGVVPTVDGRPLPVGQARPVPAGTRIGIGFGDGARGYLAVRGGIVVRDVLDGKGTDLRAGFGGHEGRALRPGDRLAVGAASEVARPMRWTGSRAAGPIRIVPGPHADELDALTAAEWTVGPEADRAGVRLDGRSLPGGEAPSMGLPLGAIQLPPDGRPIVMLVDRPVTGGYLVPACVIGADVGRVAQLRTGDGLRFEVVSLDDARDAWTDEEDALRSVEPVASDDDPLAWTGAHG